MISSDEELCGNFDDVQDEHAAGDMLDSIHMEKLAKNNFFKLKRLRAKFNLTVKLERHRFLQSFQSLIDKWKGPLPDLRLTYRPQEIDRLLAESVTHWCKTRENSPGKRFIEFVLSTGYKDVPLVEAKEDEKPLLLRRTTPLHRAARRKHYDLVAKFFEIYDTFDVNYVDETGFTHFHAACVSGRVDVVEKFLDYGQHPDFLPRESDVIQIDLLMKQPDPPLLLALMRGHTRVVELLLRRGANPNIANKAGSTPLHRLGERRKDDDSVKMFFEIIESIHQTRAASVLQVDVSDKLGRTPLLLAVVNRQENLARLLLEHGADINLANQTGSTPLHIICHKVNKYELAEWFLKLSKDTNRTVRIDARDELGRTPLHLALKSRDAKLTELLLKHGADPNLANEEGSTPLHIICQNDYDDDNLIETFFEINDQVQQEVRIDARDKSGRTPLHLALAEGHKTIAESLLRRGADPNLANAEGSTPLHVICQNFTLERDHRKAIEMIMRNDLDSNFTKKEGSIPPRIIIESYHDDDPMELFFNINDENHLKIQVDAVDKLGRTPLHLAMYYGCRSFVELLLKRGANPNLADAEGLTPLHVICMFADGDDDNDDYHLAEIFFDVNDELHQTVQIDAVDNFGRTPLQWAAASLAPNVVDILLRRGADLSSFVFPTEKYFASLYSLECPIHTVVFSTMCIVELLESKGYKLEKTAALTIMKSFAEHGLFQQSADLEKYLRDDEDFANLAKKQIVSSSLTLYDFVRLSPEEAEKVFNQEDCDEFLSVLYSLPEKLCFACLARTSEIMLRGFLRYWALTFFPTLTCHQLSIPYCEKILDMLSDEDLLRTCLAANGQN